MSVRHGSLLGKPSCEPPEKLITTSEVKTTIKKVRRYSAAGNRGHIFCNFFKRCIVN
jgi:hypothetical protein